MPNSSSLLAQDLERQGLRQVVLGQEIDDRHAALLTVAMAAADALLDALRVPGQVVVDDGVAELEVQALSGNEHARPRPELVDQRQSGGDSGLSFRPASRGTSSVQRARASCARLPSLVPENRVISDRGLDGLR